MMRKTLLSVLIVCWGCADDPVEVEPPPGPPEIEVNYTETRPVCADRSPLRNLYWGDLHVHTTLSFDAYVHGVRTGPADAYRFARGQELLLPPLDDNGQGTRPVKLSRPLDFAAVTDHAELLAEVRACVDPASAAYDTLFCDRFRNGGPTAYVPMGVTLADPESGRLEEICGLEGFDCPGVAKGIWGSIVEAADAYTDWTEACTFTAMPAYEYSAGPGLSNLHRNVIFRTGAVPELPVTFYEEPTAKGLWTALKRECIEETPGCDVLAIPHNPNWSNGNMFAVEYPGAASAEEEAEQAALRAEMEPLVEIYQHKGDSECRNGFAGVLGEPDELCDFEKLRDESAVDCGDTPGEGAMSGVGCVSRLDFVRGVLGRGLQEDARIGANPFKLGIIASTDTHAGIPGLVSESDWPGHLGNNDDEPAEAMKPIALTPGAVIDSPGGLAAVWAVENSRDGIFEALRRRETYGTSGPRIALRFFGGWGYEEDTCADPSMLEIAYDRGAPMGSDLPPAPEGASAPTFLVSALRDSLDGSTPLQQVQIVKGWIDADGALNERVFVVAGTPDNGADVNTSTCERSGDGHDALCATWTDTTWEPGQRAFWYARVVENPSCRWHAWWCSRLASGDQPSACSDPTWSKVIQERAWSSPVWSAP